MELLGGVADDAQYRRNTKYQIRRLSLAAALAIYCA
jgi:hypothetical protein